MRNETLSFTVAAEATPEQRAALVADIKTWSGVLGVIAASNSSTHPLGRRYIVSLALGIGAQAIAAMVEKLKALPNIENVATKDPRRC